MEGAQWDTMCPITKYPSLNRVNMPCKFLKGILVLSESEQSFARDTNKFYSLHILKVSVIVKGKPYQLYNQGMRSFEQYHEICKYFMEGLQKDAIVDEAQKYLQFHELSIGEYLTDKYTLWLDFKTIDGRRIENTLEGVTLQIKKSAESAGVLKAYIYLIMDAQLNSKDGAFLSVDY